MNALVQVGETTWVDPEAIQAIEWSDWMSSPKILLDNGLHVLATSFKVLDHPVTSSLRKASTKALIEKIAQAMRKPTPPTFSGRAL
jgi:hypothetical protein